MQVLIVVVLITIGITTIHAVGWEHSDTAADKCAQKHNLDNDVYQRLRKGENIDAPEVKEHLLCYFKEMEMFSENSHWEKKQIKTLSIALGTKDDDVDKILTTCAIEKSTPQESVWHYWKCAAPIIVPKIK